MIWRQECLCDNVARYLGGGVIDVCVSERKKSKVGAENYDVCAFITQARIGELYETL